LEWINSKFKIQNLLTAMPLHHPHSPTYRYKIGRFRQRFRQRLRQQFRSFFHWLNAIATGKPYPSKSLPSQFDISKSDLSKLDRSNLSPQILKRPAARETAPSVPQQGYWDVETTVLPYGGSRSVFRPLDLSEPDLELASLFSQAELEVLNHSVTPVPAAPQSSSMPLFVGDRHLDQLTQQLLLKQDQQTQQIFHLQLMVRELQEQLANHRRTLDQLSYRSDWLLSGFSAETDAQPFSAKFCHLMQSSLAEVEELRAIAIAIDQSTHQVNHVQTTQQKLLCQVQTSLAKALPNALPQINILICQDQGRFYALPSQAIAQVLFLHPEQLVIQVDRTYLHWSQQYESEYSKADIDSNQSALLQVTEAPIKQESFVDLHTIAELFRSANSAQNNEQVSRLYGIVLQTQSGLKGLRVEQVLGQQELMVYQFGLAIAPPPSVSGCCVLENGQLALVLDIEFAGMSL
jgi:hypothetical protein